ncbi:GTPase [Gillisia sp. Hel_I_29]|uniref:GTPase n=1 Tax=Gillisia sp. Hel_I_29 TaxID=1249975 RepID=UPI000554247D|nr:GTPase [Gillisia sp. Hel_I_29]
MSKKFSEIIYYKYLETVQESGVLNTYEAEHGHESEFAYKLTRCKMVAQKEFISCHHEIVQIFDEIIKIDKSINKDINNIQNKYSTYDEIWGSIFDEFNFALTEIFNYGSDKLIASFEEKIQRIDKFTICLFGKSKVGKSTTMEALTNGDGSTIGIGRQNTTKDVKEYSWNDLKVIDTPGIDTLHKIDQLDKLALQYADKSDLIAFLMPHQIDESDFEKFKLFYQQKKPIIIILNVKQSAGKLGTKDLEMFLKNSDRIFEESKIQEYKDRINDYVLNVLGIEKDLIPIIPIHSESAFLSNNSTDKVLSEKLNSISNFENLKNLLITEVTEFGELYRIKNPHETVKLFSDKIVGELNVFNSFLDEQQKVFIRNIEKFNSVKHKISQIENSIIQKILGNYFQNKLSVIDFVINQLFDAKEEQERKKILDDFICESEMRICIDKANSELQNAIKKEVKDYFNCFSDELQLLDLNFSKSSLNISTSEKITDIDKAKSRSNVIDGARVISGVFGGIVLGISGTGLIGGATGTVFGLGSTNFWNPVGWGLMGLGIVLSIAGMFLSRKQKKKIAEAKNKARSELKKEIKAIKNNLINEILDSNAKIIEQIKVDHIDVLSEYQLYSKKHQSEIKSLKILIEKIAIVTDKNKYQAIIDNLSNTTSCKIQNVIHSEKLITLILEELPDAIHELQRVFTRVEEKQVILLKA